MTPPVPARSPVRLYEAADPSLLWPTLLADHGQIAPVEIEPGAHGWLVLSWNLNRRVLTDTRAFARDPAWWRELHDGTIGPASGLRALYGKRQSALFCDGAEHQRYRDALVAALGRLTRQQVTRHIAEAANRLIDAFCLHGKADLIAQYARQLPLTVLCRLFGLAPDDTVRVCSAMQTLWEAGADAPAAKTRIEALLVGLARKRRAAPSDDLASGLVSEGMSDDEVRDQLTLVIAAGDDPVTHLIGNTLRMLLTSPGLRASVAGSRTLVAETINASLWTDPPVQALIGRYPTADVELGGVRVRRGDCLVIGYAAAHLDLMARTDPAVAQANRAHLTWGAGPHTCPRIGRSLTLAIAETAVEQLLHRLPDLRLAVDADLLRRRPSLSVRALTDLPVEFTPAAPERMDRGDSIWNRPAPTPSDSTPRRGPTSTPGRASSGRRGPWYGWLFPVWRSGR